MSCYARGIEMSAVLDRYGFTDEDSGYIYFHMDISEDPYQHGQQHGQKIDLIKRTADIILR